MKKLLKYLIWLFAGLFGFVLILLLSVYFTLRSPGAMKTLFDKFAAPRLVEKNIHVSFSSLSFDLFSGIKLTNLKAQVNQPQNHTQIDLSLPQFILRYQFRPLLQKKLIVDEINLDSLSLIGEIELPPGKDSPEEQPTGKSEAFSLYNFLAQPPLLVEAPKIGISCNKIALTLKQKDQLNLKTEINNFLFSLVAKLQPHHFSLEQSLQIGNSPESINGLKLSLNQSGKDGTSTSVYLEQNLAESFTLNLDNTPPGKTKVSIQQIKIKEDLRSLKLVLGKDKNLTTLNIPQLDFDFYSQLEFDLIKDADLSVPNQLLPLTLKGRHLLTLPKISLQTTTADAEMSLSTEVLSQSIMSLTVGSLTEPEKNQFENFSLSADVSHLQLKTKTKTTSQTINLGLQNIILSKTPGDSLPTFHLTALTKNLSYPAVLRQPLSLQIDVLTQLKESFTDLSNELNFSINNEKFFSGNLSVTQKKDLGEATYQLKLSYPQVLEKLLKNLNLSSQLGIIATEISGKNQWQLPPPSPSGNPHEEKTPPKETEPFKLSGKTDVFLWQNKLPKKPQIKISDKLHLTLDYSLAGQEILAKTSLNFKEIYVPQIAVIKNSQLNTQIDKKGDKISLALDGKIPFLKIKQLPKALNLTLNDKLDLIPTPFSVNNALNLTLDQEEVLQLKIQAHDLAKNLTAKLALIATSPKILFTLVPELKSVPAFGKMQVEADVSANLNHPYGSWLEQNPAPELTSATVNSQATLKLKQLQKPDVTAKQAIIINTPLTLDITAKQLSKQKIAVNTRLALPDFKFLPMAAINNLNLNVDALATGKSLAQMHNFDIATTLKIAGTELLEKDLKTLVPKELLQNFSLALQTSLNLQKYVNLKKLELALGEILKLDLSGTLDGQSLETYIAGDIRVNPSGKTFNSKDLNFDGSINFPWVIANASDRSFTIESTPSFRNFSLQFKPKSLQLKKLNGFLNLKEHIQLTADKQIRFSYLTQQNAFERVDYLRHAPLLDDKSIGFELLQLEKLKVGPFRGIVEIEQNMVNLHRFDLNFIGGSITGDLALNAYPKNLNLRLLTRMTNLQPDLLTHESITDTDSSLSLRTALLFDINKSLVDGSVVIDKIGSNQLIGLINFLDPKNKDDQLNSARTALGVAYPTYVSVDMQQGQLDMDIDLNALGVSKTINVRKVPLYAFMASAMDEILKKIREVPVQ